MAFEVLIPGVWKSADPLREGWASISKNGKLMLHAKDLARVAIKDRAVTLFDEGTFRIAFRAPREDEKAQARPFTIIPSGKLKRDSGRRSLDIGRAVRRLGLAVENAAGRYELGTHGQGRDAILVLCLMPDVSGIGTPTGKGKAGGK